MKKMNMVDKFVGVKALLNGEKVEGFTLEDALEFIDGRIDQVNKKNTSGNGERKPTKTQLENEGIKQTLLGILSATGEPMTIADVQKASADLEEMSNQKISALLTQLVKANLVLRTEVKGKAHFAVAE